MNSMMAKIVFPCEKIREFVYDYAEGGLSPLTSMRFRMHIKACDCCGEYVRLYLLAANPEEFRKRMPPPSEFMDKTLEFLEREGILDQDGADSKREKPDGL